jgi:hypothetical protein
MSSPALSISLFAEPLRSLAFGSISGTYAGIGTAFAHPSRIMHITNTTDVLLTFSMDGVNDHFVVPTNGFILIDITSNKANQVGVMAIAQGTRIYVKGSPTLGSVYLSTFYGING